MIGVEERDQNRPRLQMPRSAVRENMKKVRKRRARVSRLLTRDGASTKMIEITNP
jgi:hypothetical protein